MKAVLKKYLPPSLYETARFLHKWRDALSSLDFVATSAMHLSRKERVALLRRYYRISDQLPSPHMQREIIAFARHILSLPSTTPGVIVEAGYFKGSSTAKFSLATRLAGRTLHVFDSFEGIPENEEQHERNIFGGVAGFRRGDYAGGLEEVKDNVGKYGCLETCQFHRGWFDDTLPGFTKPVAAAYIDVDLVSSTKTCLKWLYPLLPPGGKIFSQDGHLPLIIELLKDRGFWREEIGCEPPAMTGLNKSRLIAIHKPLAV